MLWAPVARWWLVASWAAPCGALQSGAPRGAARRGAPCAAKQKSYYDFRRTNDGMLHEGPQEPEAAPKARASATKGGETGHHTGQVHYHNLHIGKIVQGIKSHLLELGLGSEMEIGGFDDFDGHVMDLLANEERCPPLTTTEEWVLLEEHTAKLVKTHLRDLLNDADRCDGLSLEMATTVQKRDEEKKPAAPTNPEPPPSPGGLYGGALNLQGAIDRVMHPVPHHEKDAGKKKEEEEEEDGPIFLDWSRQKVTEETMELLFRLARRMGVERKVERMRRGERINTSEKRAVLHMALRAPRSRIAELAAEFQRDPPSTSAVPLAKAIEASCDVRDRIWAFADAVRRGEIVNLEGDAFENVIVVGIGGSYLGPQFVAEAVSTNIADADRMELRFVANVDPVGVQKATRGLNARRSLVVVVSKSWTTRETIRNANEVRKWVEKAWEGSPFSPQDLARSQFLACASRESVKAVERWGIDGDRLFEFWSWVGGRYSSCASAGVLPLALACGSAAARDFLDGAHAVDEHFFTEPLESNVPAVMALLGVWNVNFLGLSARAVVPYADGLSRFASHVQQLEMESNGKSVTIDGRPLEYTTGEIVFGEPGTNAQHSFFQLLHMGQCVPCDFIGFMRPTIAENKAGHDELMANFFAQPDALAVGRTFEDVLNDVRVGDSDDLALCPHRTLSGDRPSLSLLLPSLSARSVGALLALYEHRCAVQGFVWDLNSWDQWGVELGKTLANEVRSIIEQRWNAPKPNNPSTARLLQRYQEANSHKKHN